MANGKENHEDRQKLHAGKMDNMAIVAIASPSAYPPFDCLPLSSALLPIALAYLLAAAGFQGYPLDAPCCANGIFHP